MVTHQTMAAQGASMKIAKNTMLRMLLCLGRVLQQWGLESWVRSVQWRKQNKAKKSTLKMRNLMRLGMAMERWGNQAERRAERTAFEIQLFETKSQLAGAHKGNDMIQPLVMEAERKVHMELGAHRTALLLARGVMVGLVKAYSHWRERVSGRLLVSKLLSQVVDDAAVEDGLRQMYVEWQESQPIAAHNTRVPAQMAGPDDWIEGVTKISSKMQQNSDEDKLRVAATQYAAQRNQYLDQLGSNVQKSAEFLESSTNCALVLHMQTVLNARKKAEKRPANLRAPISQRALAESRRVQPARGELPAALQADAEVVSQWDRMEYDALERVRYNDHLTSWLKDQSE